MGKKRHNIRFLNEDGSEYCSATFCRGGPFPIPPVPIKDPDGEAIFVGRWNPKIESAEICEETGEGYGICTGDATYTVVYDRFTEKDCKTDADKEWFYRRLRGDWNSRFEEDFRAFAVKNIKCKFEFRFHEVLPNGSYATVYDENGDFYRIEMDDYGDLFFLVNTREIRESIEAEAEADAALHGHSIPFPLSP